MMKRHFTFRNPLLLLLMLLASSCHCNNKTAEGTRPATLRQVQPMADAPALVYKTRKDYSRFVPVIMNAEKTRIISYPHPADIYHKGKLAYPTPLKDGYLLDNRGIGPNVAFLNITYETYSRFKSAPDMETLMNDILDKEPLSVLWNCGARSGFGDEVKELNALIEKGFSGCTNLVKEYKVYLEH